MIQSNFEVKIGLTDYYSNLWFNILLFQKRHSKTVFCKNRSQIQEEREKLITCDFIRSCLQCVHVVAALPSVSCRSNTLRIWDSGISAMCLSGGGGLVCPSGLLNVLITLCLFLAICRHTHTQNETATLGVNVKKDNFLKTSCTCISVCVSPCNPELSVGAFCSVCGESCYRLLGNKSMRPS